MTKEEFYTFYKGKKWTVMCPTCEKPVECNPHYRDKKHENDYGICPECGKKLYVAE